MRLRTLQTACFCLLLILLLGGGFLLYDLRTHPRPIAGPMVQLAGPDGFAVVCELFPDQAAELEVLTPAGQSVGRFPGRSDGLRTVAVASGLEPGESYRYRIWSGPDGGDLVAESSVRTPPRPEQPFRVLAFGDSGDGRAPQYRLARQMTRFDPDLIVHTGDLIYSRGARADYDIRFYRPNRELIARAPFAPCLGNHDFRTRMGAPLIETFLLPENGPTPVQRERNYWFDFGCARFVVFDSNADEAELAGVVAPWLDGVLASAGEKWKVVYFHEPIYTHTRHTPSQPVRNAIAPLLDRHRVDLVLCGHNHLYERTYPIREGKVVGPGEGTVHITTGAGGARLYDENRPNSPLIAAYFDAAHSFTILDIAPDLILLRQHADGGKVVDEYQIQRRAREAGRSATQVAGR